MSISEKLEAAKKLLRRETTKEEGSQIPISIRETIKESATKPILTKTPEYQQAEEYPISTYKQSDTYPGTLTVSFGEEEASAPPKIVYGKTEPGIWPTSPKTQEYNVEVSGMKGPSTISKIGSGVKEYITGIPGAIQGTAKYLGERREAARKAELTELWRQTEIGRQRAQLEKQRVQTATYQRATERYRQTQPTSRLASPMAPMSLGNGGMRSGGFGSPSTGYQTAITAQQLGGGMSQRPLGFGSPTSGMQTATATQQLGGAFGFQPRVSVQPTLSPVQQQAPRPSQVISTTQLPQRQEYMEQREKRHYIKSGIYSPKTNPGYNPRQQWRKVKFIDPRTGETYVAKMPKIPRERSQVGGEEYGY